MAEVNQIMVWICLRCKIILHGGILKENKQSPKPQIMTTCT